MKTNRNILLGFTIIFIANACLIPITTKKHFKIHKEPVIYGANKCKLRTDGIYVSTNSSDACVFYSNGLVKSLFGYIDHSLFWANPKQGAIEIQERSRNDEPSEKWGEYSIHNDIISYDYFIFNKQEFFVRQTIHADGIILSDTSFVINSKISTFENYELFSEPIYFRFYKTKLKPDSTKVWYLNKRWYKKNQHASRKRSTN